MCKRKLGWMHIGQSHLNDQQKTTFEQCLIKNFLVPHGWDYFGKRDVIYLDMYDNEDVRMYTDNTTDHSQGLNPLYKELPPQEAPEDEGGEEEGADEPEDDE